MRLAVFDVGGTAIKYAAMMDGEMDGKGEVPTPTTCSGDFLAAIEGVLDALRAEGDIEGVALSLPGVIDAGRGLVVTSGALPYNDGARASAWEERWGVPVRIDNDARCATMAELSCGNLAGVETGAVLAFGTGVGGGIVVGGRVHTGRNLYAGELGMMFDRPARRDTALADEGSLSVQASTIGLCRRVAEAKGIARCDGREVFSWIEAGDEAASRVFAEVCDVIAVHIHNLQCALDPERVCLGGGVSRNPLFVEGVRAAHRRFNEGLSYAFPEVEIMPCRFFNDANLIGAYQNFLARR